MTEEISRRGANLSGADLSDADLRGADLSGANLRGADLSDADLRHADLRHADLRHADLRGADLRHADLRGADLRHADLRHADLRGAEGGILRIDGMPSGQVTMIPLATGWRLTIGCWSGTPADLRALIAKDEDWPEAHGEEILRRRPGLAALADLADAHATAHADYLAAVAQKWGAAK